MKRSGPLPRYTRMPRPPRCRIAGCLRKVHGRGLCDMHRQREYKYGNPEHLTERMRRAVAIRELWARIVAGEAGAPEGCWEWSGTRNRKGYGVLRRNGQHLATRAAWVEVNGRIPDGLSVLHRCDNPPCVRPSHLFLGTSAENSSDMVRKGRAPANFGELNVRAKLSREDVQAIRRLRAAGASCKSIAVQFGVHPAYVSRVSRGLRRAYDSLEQKTRTVVATRSEGVCEVCGQRPGESMHHRKNRSQGGRWTPANILHTCGDGTRGCHGLITSMPAASRLKGWSVRSHDAPVDVRVCRRGQWVVLGDDGAITPTQPPERAAELLRVATNGAE